MTNFFLGMLAGSLGIGIAWLIVFFITARDRKRSIKAEENLSLVKVVGKAFDKEKIDFDGFEYVDCTFYDCELRYSGGASVLRNCKLNNPDIVVTGPAERTIRWLSIWYRDGSKKLIEATFERIRNGYYLANSEKPEAVEQANE